METGNNSSNVLVVNVSPHIYERQSTESIMRDVLIAMVPAALAGFYYFGLRALLVVLTSVSGCMISEWIFQKIARRPNTLYDGSAAVTGVLLAFCLPSTLPLYMVFAGGCVSIIAGKMVFGGLGYNIFNPALVGRAVLMASWPQDMTTWSAPGGAFPGFYDTVARATPLAGFKTGSLSSNYWDLFTGNIGGCLGETSAAAILIGGIFLMARKVIKPVIPLCFIGSVFVMSFLLKFDPVYAVLSGGVFLGAFFMATDYATSPLTTKGRIIFGVGCGIITVMIRGFGGFPEGVCYAILFMNGLVPLIDRYTKPKAFGV